MNADPIVTTAPPMRGAAFGHRYCALRHKYDPDSTGASATMHLRVLGELRTEKIVEKNGNTNCNNVPHADQS